MHPVEITATKLATDHPHFVELWDSEAVLSSRFHFCTNLLSSAFRILSESDSELVSAEKLQKVAKRLGVKLSRDEALELIKVVDEDENGEIGLQEFHKLMCEQVSIDELRNELEQTFAVFDKDTSGSITCEGLGTLIKEFDGHLKEAETVQMIKVADINSSGTIEMDEFVKILIDETDDTNSPE